MPRRNSGGEEDLQPVINSALSAFFQLGFAAQVGVVVVVLIIGLIAVKYFAGGQHFLSGSSLTSSPDMALGNPSDATTDPANRNNYLMVKPYYALSYNDAKGTPNWVSWCVTQADLGQAPRKDEFDPDALLPSDFYHVSAHDYTGSGFDRGHMCPHSDRAADEQMSFATFVMSNIIPQAPNVNRKAWAQMEDYCRELVRHHDRLFITAGPAGQGGRGSNGFRSVLAEGRVTVPGSCWKIVVDIPDDGTGDISTISTDARVLSVEMPNDQTQVNDEWEQYRVTPAAIEQQTGLHFFTNLRPEVANIFRQRLDRMPLPRPRPLMH